MSGKFVRASKFRHVYGQPFKKELCYENLKPTLSAFDSNIVQANGKYLSLNSNGIGAFIVIPVGEVGKAPDKVPMFRGHTGGNVLDTAFDPFNDKKMASAGEDGKIMLWEIPENYSFNSADPENIQDVTPVASLTGHTRKVGHLCYHPVAQNVLASSSFDYSVKLWNLDTKTCEVTLQHKDLVTSFSFNYNGTKLATASRDKKIRVWDIRTGEILSEGQGHNGAKSCRICWLGNSDRIATTGFDRFSERQLGLWKADAIESGPIGGLFSVDSSSGILMPFFDPSTNLLFVAGKGDGNIRYYEFADDDLFELSEYQSTDPQRGFAIAPKRSVNVKENEIIRGFKLLNDNSIEPLSFIVPRRSEMFQDDIFPDAPAGVPAMSAEDYFAGKTVAGPILLSMSDVYSGSTSPALSKSKAETPKKETSKKESTTSDSKPKTKTDVPKKEEISEPSRAVFTKSQEQGVEDMLNKKEINSLLDKVNNLSDDDTPEIDNSVEDKNWEEDKKPIVSESVSTLSSKPNSKLESSNSSSITVDTATEAPTLTSALSTPTASSKATTVTTIANSTATASVSSKVGAAAGGLKATVDKLQTLVSSLQGAVEKLTATGLEKDQRLKSLEDKIDQLLNKY